MQFIILGLLMLLPSYAHALQANISWTNNWTAISPATQNIIKRGTSELSYDTQYATNPDISQLIDNTVKEGQSYYWQAFAQNSIGLSDGSNVACATWWQGVKTVLTVPNPTNGQLVVSAPAPSISGIQWQIDGINTGPENTIPPYGFTWNTSGLAGGTHILSAVIRNSDNTLTTTKSSFVIPVTLVASLNYILGEGTGNTAKDSSGKGLDGIISNATWITPDNTNASGTYAISFNTGGKITSPLADHGTLRSYTFWVKRTGPGTNNMGRIFDKRTTGIESELFYNDELTRTYLFIRHWSNAHGMWSIPQPSLNVWHHIAIVYDASLPTNSPTIYVDGISQTISRVGTPNGTPVMNTDPYIIGNRGAGDRTWAGAISKFQIYPNLLKASDIPLTQ